MELALPKEERRNKTALYNPMPLRAVQEMYPELPLVEYVNGITLYEPANVDEDEVDNVTLLYFPTCSKIFLYILDCERGSARLRAAGASAAGWCAGAGAG